MWSPSQRQRKFLKAGLPSHCLPSRLQATIDGISFNIRRYVHTETGSSSSSRQADRQMGRQAGKGIYSTAQTLGNEHPHGLLAIRHHGMAFGRTIIARSISREISGSVLTHSTAKKNHNYNHGFRLQHYHHHFLPPARPPARAEKQNLGIHHDWW